MALSNVTLAPFFSDQLNRTRIGMCVQYEEGTFVLEKTLYVSPMYLVYVGEVLGLFYVLQWLSDMQFDKGDFVLDSKLTTYTFHYHRVHVTEYRQVISSYRSLFTTYFTNSQVEFNRWQTNEVAHTLEGVATLSATPITYYVRHLSNILLLMKWYKNLTFKKKMRIRYCWFWISKLLYLDFQILLSIEVATRLSHDQVALFKTFRDTTQNCARQTINHVVSRIKQAQLQLCG